MDRSRTSEGPAHAEIPQTVESDAAWRDELTHRLRAYRARRSKTSNPSQPHLPFEPARADSPAPLPVSAVAVEDLERARPASTDVEGNEDFSFTIAIGRNAATREHSRMVIDVSQPPATVGAFAAAPATEAKAEAHPAASLEERRFAGFIDATCLLFAYGGFLTLFGSLGGQFTLSKLSAAVCVTTFVIVYLQYFALFTVFGGTTPGMMMRGLHVVNSSGDAPTPRQMLCRSAGYMLSAGTLFMGFFWALWDEERLTWHDRLSHTYVAPAPTFADMDAKHVAHTR